MNEDIPGDVVIREDATEIHRKGKFYFVPGGPVGFAVKDDEDIVFTLGPLISDFYSPAAAREVVKGLLRIIRKVEQHGRE